MSLGVRFPAAIASCALLLACGDGEDEHTPCCAPPPVTSPSPAAPGPTPGAHSGATEITFLAADPAPGSTLTGCRTDASGCDGRIRMRFRLRSPTGGPVLNAVAFLHAQNLLACWRATTGPFQLAAGDSELAFVFDQREPACAAPNSIETMKLVVEGTVEVASLQEWKIHYDLRP